MNQNASWLQKLTGRREKMEKSYEAHKFNNPKYFGSRAQEQDDVGGNAGFTAGITAGMDNLQAVKRMKGIPWRKRNTAKGIAKC